MSDSLQPQGRGRQPRRKPAGEAPATRAPQKRAGEAPGRRPVPRPDEIYDPVARALDFIGDRWSLVLVRLLLLGPQGFQDLRVRTGIAPRVLSSRLKQLADQGFIERFSAGYRITEGGRTLEPIVASIARWYTRHGFAALNVRASQFTASAPQSILEALPFLLKDERAADASVVFEIRLTGEGGGVWTVAIDQGVCTVEASFADHADVRYTAEARVWCEMALGLKGARELVRSGLITKDGSDEAMDHYFHQISHEAVPSAEEARPEQSESKGEEL